MKIKKILIISGGIWPPAIKMAGTAAIYELSKNLAQKNNLEIHILTSLVSWSDPDFKSWANLQKKKYNLTFHFVKAAFFESCPFFNLGLTRFLFFLKIINLNKRFNYDLIHDYSSLPFLIGFTSFLGKLCRFKTIHTLFTVNTTPLGSMRLVFGLNWMDKVICTSRLLKSDLIKGRRDSNKIAYVPFGIDTKKFKALSKDKSLIRKINLSQKSRVVSFLGPLAKKKGVFVLAKAVKKVTSSHPESVFVFASYGKEGRDPHYYLNKKKLEKILFGMKRNVRFLEGKQNVPKLMSITDIFVLPAVSLHGTLAQPLTLLEAMGMGKACVVSDIQTGDGLVKNEVNCLLFKSGNADDLAKKINFLLANPDFAKKIGQAARKRIVTEFDIKKTKEKIHALYKEILR